jgi:quercetin dioxygenase-like cupin family protein
VSSKLLHARWADLPRETLAGGALTRSGVRTDGSLLVFNWIAPGALSPPPHDHPFDQLALILEGTAAFDIAGSETVVSAGELILIPSGVPHTARVVGDIPVLNVDLFAPAREDYVHLTEHQSR